MGPKRIFYHGILYMVGLLVVCVYFRGHISIYFNEIRGSKTTPYNCTRELMELNFGKVNQDDARLITAIKRCSLQSPSELPYNLKNPKRRDYSQSQNAHNLDKLLNHTSNGFFVECGAFDGESLSNTLYFEKYRSWTGLLIEPLPVEFEKMHRKNRKAYITNACLSKHAYPTQVQFFLAGYYSRIVEKNSSSSKRRVETIQCFPLYSLLLATGYTRVDLFSLDIEGDEMTVLKTVPWKDVDIKVIVVEYNHIKEGKAALIHYMENQGYTYRSDVDGGWQDAVFVKNGFNKT